MRIVLDLQACQTDSRHRGIGRYSGDLTKALLASGTGHEWMLGIDGTYPDPTATGGEGLAFPTAGGRIKYFYPGPRNPHGHPKDGLRPAAAALVRASYAPFSADVVHVNSLFEGCHEHAAPLDALAHLPGAVSSVTLYDLIPKRFPDKYLTDQIYRNWYESKLLALRKFDVLLCISEATKRDAMEVLDIPEHRLAVINAGVSSEFKPARDREATVRIVRDRFGIRERFVLYTGNGDFRKNLSGAVEAFARIPASQRTDVQLVLNQVHDEASLFRIAAAHGLAPRDLVVTGRVSDDDLIAMLQTCDTFFFPSLYEGFGLPVLEAMACGAPTIAADNSSLPEVVLREDAMFDVHDVDAAASTLARALQEPGFRDSLVQSGIARAREFTWARSSRQAIQAWEEAIDRQQNAVPGAKARPAVRRKVALVTPLPPEQTGIADYMLELLLPLTRYFDLDIYTSAAPELLGDLPSVMRVRHWRELAADRARFDQVIYQFGNSPFHSHMLAMLREMPGIVVLHDFYLSSMIAHMDEHEGYSGSFRHELEYAHGRPALVTLEGDGGVALSRKVFPVSRSVVEQADAIIVHSRRSGELCTEFYPFVERGSWFVLPMPISTRATVSKERSRLRAALGVEDDEFLIVSFGFMADTKLNLELLQALEHPLMKGSGPVRMVFVGQADGGEYGRRVAATIAGHALKDRISITGFASGEDYRTYLLAADCAVQLRTMGRGETSKAVMDCLACALPTLVNDYGSFGELPDGVVLKVDAAAEPVGIAACLRELRNSIALRDRLGGGAQQHIRKHHSPDAVAEAYSEVLEVSLVSRKERSGDVLVKTLADIHQGPGLDEAELAAVSHSVGQAGCCCGPTRLLVDISEIVDHDYGTGIHRVVRNMAHGLSLLEKPTARVVTAVAHDAHGHARSAEDYLTSVLDLPPVSRLTEALPGSRYGDVLFLLDSAWERPERFKESVERVRGNGGRVGAMVYDLIPLLHPHYCVEFMPAVFEKWLRFVVGECDFLVCISRSVADDLKKWIDDFGARTRENLCIGHVHLGSELREDRPERDGVISDQFAVALAEPSPFVLMVGTIEPRKRHDLALDAFDALWKEGNDLRLLVIGKQGWNVEELAQRMRSHPQAGNKLLWLEAASDSELSRAYAAASRVLQASDAEGFGLPIVEAAFHGKPLLVSDIPVFKEIAGEAADYFAVGDLDSLIAGLKTPARQAQHGAATTMSWSDSCKWLLRLIDEGAWDHVLR